MVKIEEKKKGKAKKVYCNECEYGFVWTDPTNHCNKTICYINTPTSRKHFYACPNRDNKYNACPYFKKRTYFWYLKPLLFLVGCAVMIIVIVKVSL